MSRPIKFRAWDGHSMWYSTENHTVWCGGVCCSINGDDMDQIKTIEYDNVMQFTGRTSNGKEIYEGDILRSDNPNDGYGDPSQKETVDNIVSWSDDEACFQIGDLLMDMDMNYYEIIGNIHEE